MRGRILFLISQIHWLAEEGALSRKKEIYKGSSLSAISLKTKSVLNKRKSLEKASL